MRIVAVFVIIGVRTEMTVAEALIKSLCGCIVAAYFQTQAPAASSARGVRNRGQQGFAQSVAALTRGDRNRIQACNVVGTTKKHDSRADHATLARGDENFGAQAFQVATQLARAHALDHERGIFEFHEVGEIVNRRTADMHGQRRTRLRGFGHGGREHRAQPSRCARGSQRSRVDQGTGASSLRRALHTLHERATLCHTARPKTQAAPVIAATPSVPRVQ